MIFTYCLTVFITQVIFIGLRTLNIKQVAKGDTLGAIISGAFVHVAWLISVTVGVVSMKEIIASHDYRYVPVVIFSILGGAVGTYYGMNFKNNKK